MDTSQERATDYVHISFELEPDENGWPPVQVETVWAAPVEDGYEIANIPFFTPDIALGDVVSAEEEDGALYATDVIRRSGHGTVRIIVADLSYLEVATEACERFGCEWETLEDEYERLIAVDIPPDADRDGLRAWLHQEVDNGHLDFEEGLVDWDETAEG